MEERGLALATPLRQLPTSSLDKPGGPTQVGFVYGTASVGICFLRGKPPNHLVPNRCETDFVRPPYVYIYIHRSNTHFIFWGRVQPKETRAAHTCIPPTCLGAARNRIPFQLGCWEMQKNPYGMSEEGNLARFSAFPVALFIPPRFFRPVCFWRKGAPSKFNQAQN